ncbi:hypothetical protein D3C71_277930 [compost metagenome]
MSRIHFHSPSDTFDIAGMERYHADFATRDKMWEVFGGEEAGIELLHPYLPEFWRRMDAKEVRYFVNGSRGFGGGVLNIEGHELYLDDIALNTALDVGSDALRLLARLHAQSEIHCWVDGPNRNWMADIIAAGRAEGVLREEMGWEALADFLRSRDDEPVVCSYSVCESFPNFGLLPDTHRLKIREAKGDDIDDILDAYYSMRWQTQWKLCMGELRNRTGRLEMKPDDWRSYHFGNGITAGRLIAALAKAASTTADEVPADG